MFGNINDLIAQLMRRQQIASPPGKIPGVGISDPNPSLIPGGSGVPGQYAPGPLSLLAQQMAAGSRQPPVGAAGTPGGQSVPGFGNVRTPGAPNMSIPTPQVPGILGQQYNPYASSNPFQQFGGIFSGNRMQTR